MFLKVRNFVQIYSNSLTFLEDKRAKCCVFIKRDVFCKNIILFHLTSNNSSQMV